MEKVKYDHTQIGYLIITILVLLLLYLTTILIITNFETITLIATILITIILSSFLTLNIKVDEKSIQIKFGYGIYKKEFLINEIKSIKQVRNKWYYGWGIKVTVKPFRRIFNISGFDAIEIIFKDNSIIRIGTDEPKKLLKAIENNLI